MSHFDRIGGPNTLRMVWASLKSEHRTIGVKRGAADSDELGSCSDSDSQSSPKKICRSLGISGTCDKLEAVEIASSSDDHESLRHDSSTESEVDVSQLLNDTVARGSPQRIIEEAWAIVEEVANEIPELATTSEDSSSDSGNSECNWGYLRRFGRGRNGIMWTGNGTEVPVSFGNSSCSSDGEEAARVCRQMVLLETSGSCDDSNDELRVSSPSNRSSESASVELEWNGEPLRYMDDLAVDQHWGRRRYSQDLQDLQVELNVLDTYETDRVGDSTRVDGGGGTQSIVGEVVVYEDQQLLGYDNYVLGEGEGIGAICEQQELALSACPIAEDESSSSSGNANSKVDG